MGEPITWVNDVVTLGELKPWDRNPRQIMVEQAKRLRESFEQFGQVEVIAIGPKNEVYNGHQRLNVLKKEYGVDFELQCRRSSRPLTEHEREKLTIYLHKGTSGEWDFDILANEFDVEDLLQWGFEEWELGIDAEMPGPGEDTEPQIGRAEELRVKWGVELGQVWELGAHRLVCGDCTEQEVASLACGFEEAEMVWTDPPYGVSIGDKNKYLNTIAKSNRVEENLDNDTLDEEGLREMLDAAFDKAMGVCKKGGAWYVCAPAGPLHIIFGQLMEVRGIWHQTIQWVKNNATFSPLGVDYHWQAEPLFYGWKPGAGHRYYGGRKQTTVWEIDRPSASPEHPTMKPLELVERAVRNSSQEGEIVYDPFVGSGTTIIACENLHRECRAVELSPGYVAVTLERWAEHTGREPVQIEAAEGVAEQSSYTNIIGIPLG